MPLLRKSPSRVIARERSDRSNLTVVRHVVAGKNGEIAALPMVDRNDAGVGCVPRLADFHAHGRAGSAWGIPAKPVPARFKSGARILAEKLDSWSSELMSERVHAMTTSRDTRILIQTILKKLVAEYAPKQVILFGSYAYGTPGPDSDIDLLIIKETPERFIDRWVAVKRILTGTHPSVPLDAIVLTPDELGRRLAVGDLFIKEVFNKGEVLYAA